MELKEAFDIVLEIAGMNTFDETEGDEARANAEKRQAAVDMVGQFRDAASIAGLLTLD